MKNSDKYITCFLAKVYHTNINKQSYFVGCLLKYNHKGKCGPTYAMYITCSFSSG